MSRDETLPSLPEDVRFPLEGEGRRLEAIEFVQSSPVFTVVTFRVNDGNLRIASKLGPYPKVRNHSRGASPESWKKT